MGLLLSGFFYNFVRRTGLLLHGDDDDDEDRRIGSGSRLTDAEAGAMAVLGDPDHARYREAWRFMYGCGRVDDSNPFQPLGELARFLSLPSPSAGETLPPPFQAASIHEN